MVSAQIERLQKDSEELEAYIRQLRTQGKTDRVPAFLRMNRVVPPIIKLASKRSQVVNATPVGSKVLTGYGHNRIGQPAKNRKFDTPRLEKLQEDRIKSDDR